MKNRQKILIDDTLDQALFDNGYVVVPFLDSIAVQNLLDFFKEMYPEPGSGLYASTHSRDVDFRLQVSQRIQAEYLPSIQHTFFEYRPLGGAFIVKAPGADSILQPHQDWNIVDEQEHRSFNIWVPLVDVNKENGAVWVLPQSHNKMTTYRGINIKSAFGQVWDELWQSMECLDMQAGQALIYDHRLLHGSLANQSDQQRVATVYGITPQKAEIRYYCKEDQKVEEYLCPPDFYLTGNLMEANKELTLSRALDYDFPDLTSGQFRSIYLGEQQKGNWLQGIMQKTAHLFRRNKSN